MKRDSREEIEDRITRQTSVGNDAGIVMEESVII
jgi:hypothetical protein